MSQQSSPGRETPAEFEEKRLQSLQQILDPVTIRHLEQLEVQEGWRCLEVGTGEGSVARWLAKRVGPRGSVVAIDIDPRLMTRQYEPNLEMRQHDILVDDLEQGYYDLAHTRSVLTHLSDPVQAVNKMAAAVRPGGWLFLEEFDWISFGAVDTESPVAQAFNQKMETLAKMFQAVGVMTLQLAGPPLVAAGVLTEQDVELLRQLFADPSFYYVDGTFFGVWGRRSH
jgi:2-polyprenyl-3-methyl-5-hydroxy-6-metoxy-1,4-benzoquinol methylase